MNLKLHVLVLLTAGFTSSAGLALAQPGPGGRNCGPNAAASGPNVDCPAGPGGMRRGMGPGARSGKDYTPGWGMMSAEEQQQHRDKMASFKSYEECKAYIDQHHQQMSARAKEQGRNMPAQPRRDACASLKPAPKK